MFKRTIAAIAILAALLCMAVRADAAPRHTKDDTWLIYWYICGADNLEGGDSFATKDIAELQHVNLPPNVKVLIAAGSTKTWHHPTIKAGGHGIYLYSANRLEQQVAWNTKADNMGNPNTLASFLQYGEKNFPSDHKILLFWNHGGLSGVCYEDNENFKGDYLTYDELKAAFGAVYGNAPENPPFELIGFKACLTGSYELANSIAEFAHYMLGTEPSVYDWPLKEGFEALAKNPSINGAQIGKVICDSAIKNYSADSKRTHIFSVIDLTKMPELRGAYEAYFDEALTRADEEEGFGAAFARAAEAHNVDKYSNIYGDLGLIAENTKAIMPAASVKLLKAIDKAVVYNKRGNYLKSKGLSTYYPYTSFAKIFSELGVGASLTEESRDKNFELIRQQNSNYAAQKQLYDELLSLSVSDLRGEEGTVPVERKDGHFFARLTSEQLGNISSIQCMLLPVDQDGNSLLGGAILFSADDLKVNWDTGVVTENFRAVEPFFDGHRIITYPSVSGRGHTFYTVPVLVEGILQKNLVIRYDNSKKKYEVIGFGSDIENGMVRDGGKIENGLVITPLYMTISDDGTNEQLGLTEYRVFNEKTRKNERIPLMSVIGSIPDPNTGKMVYLKWQAGEPFVFTRDSVITTKPVRKGNYIYSFNFTAPNGESVASEPGVIIINNGKILRLTAKEFRELAAIATKAE